MALNFQNVGKLGASGKLKTFYALRKLKTIRRIENQHFFLETMNGHLEKGENRMQSQLRNLRISISSKTLN